MFKRNQVVTVGIAGLQSQYKARIVGRDKTMPGWWIVKEIPAAAERIAFFKHLPRQWHGACIHETQLSV
jgi:hypothetical protein